MNKVSIHNTMKYKLIQEHGSTSSWCFTETGLSPKSEEAPLVLQCDLY